MEGVLIRFKTRWIGEGEKHLNFLAIWKRDITRHEMVNEVRTFYKQFYKR